MTDPATEAAPAEPQPQPRWGLGDAALAFLIGILGATTVQVAYVGITGETSGFGLTIASLVGLWIGMAGVPLLACRSKGSGSLATDFGLRIEGRDLGVGVLAGVFSHLVLVNVVILFFRLIGPEVDVGDQAERLTRSAEGWRLALLAPFVGIGAPVVEELFFRGLLQRSLVRRFGVPVAVAGSAVAFGLVHQQPTMSAWSQLALWAALASFGVVLAVLAERTGRLGPSIVAHATFNTITLVALAAS